MANVKLIVEEVEDIEKKYFSLGVEVGIKLMMDKIQKHSAQGKPVLANGELYFFKDARQNLIDIMDDLESCK
ncbi:MAG: hypothetical protein IJD02_01285 [Lachnospiraceae bacterium]|nr:hypothetical protein [Lachnospiraceae bacterium]